MINMKDHQNMILFLVHTTLIVQHEYIEWKMSRTTSLAQQNIGLKLVFDYIGAWRMLLIPDWRLEGWGHLI